MKKITKLLQTMGLIMALLLASISAAAQEDKCTTVKIDKDTEIIVDIPEEYAAYIGEDELIDIALENNLKDGDRINVESLGFIDESNVPQQTIQPRLDWTITYPTTLTLLSSNVVMKDDFIISVAKGETSQLSVEYNVTVDQKISGSYYTLSAELKSSVTAKFLISKIWTGPSEGSGYNSREFRVKYYGNKYNYVQQRLLDGYVSGTKEGKVTKPTKYLSYSIDHVVN